MKLIILAMFLTFNTANAEIFKCESKEGEIAYQEAPCIKTNLQERIIVQKFDPAITEQAVKRLEEELQVFNEAEANRIESEKLKKTMTNPQFR